MLDVFWFFIMLLFVFVYLMMNNDGIDDMCYVY